MDFSLLPDEVFIMIGTMLSDPDLLSFTATAHYYYNLIHLYFKEYISLFPSSGQIQTPILVIERSHPEFDKIRINAYESNMYFGRFMSQYKQSWLVDFRYTLKHKSDAIRNVRYYFDELNESPKLIDKGHMKYICSSRVDAVESVLLDVQRKVFETLKNND